MTKQAVKIVQDADNPQPVEVIEQAIIQIAKAMKTISETRLTRKAIVVLIHHQSKIARGTIEIILNNLEELENDWLKKKI